jgi:uncharacterized protein (DUF1684 family)
MRQVLRISLAGLFCTLGIGASGSLDDKYTAEIESWRAQRLAELKSEDGWLSVTGLHWLRPGETRLGSDPASDLLLPDRFPAQFGTITRSGDKVEFRPAPGVRVLRNGAPFDGGPIASDASEHPDTLASLGVKLILLKRGERYALRIKDRESALRTEFAGLRWYPPRTEWIIPATFVPHAVPTKIKFETIVGETDEVESSGYVSFEHEGKTYRLDAAGKKNGRLWLVFRDRTSGRTTAGGARQLYADPPIDGHVILDFNKAVNLPCAYIPYATCPLAPPQNRLSLAIEAGEQKYERERADASPAASRP